MMFVDNSLVLGCAPDVPVRAAPPLGEWEARCVFPREGRRPPRDEGSELSVLEGARFGWIPNQVASTLDIQSALGANLGDLLRPPSFAAGTLCRMTPGCWSEPCARRAITISAYRRTGLTLNPESACRRFLDRQERHNVFFKEKRRIRSHMTAEVPPGRHLGTPTNLP
jgi:hypothetical protein